MGVAALVTVYSHLPEIAAGALLHPWRREVSVSPPAGCHDVTYDGAGVRLNGWRCLARGSSRGSLILLHGIADNRASLSGVIARFFSDLKTVARERAPFVLSGGLIKRAFAIAEQRGGFSIDTVDVTAAASKITRPVLLVHGTDDSATSPDHSRRVDDALAGQKELILVPGAGHNESLKKGETWDRIEWWIEDLVANLKL